MNIVKLCRIKYILKCLGGTCYINLLIVSDYDENDDIHHQIIWTKKKTRVKILYFNILNVSLKLFEKHLIKDNYVP